MVGRRSADRALQIDSAEGLDFIHPYDDPLVIAGQGTVGLEMQAARPDLDVVVAPVGGGGLVAGLALAYEDTSVEVVGVQTERFAAMKAKLDAGVTFTPSAH
ncbi:MAG: pyridoxal-phosphate dependent enzyme [Acidimicrobiales bacterium]